VESIAGAHPLIELTVLEETFIFRIKLQKVYKDKGI
jgi:hypothetical protein